MNVSGLKRGERKDVDGSEGKQPVDGDGLDFGLGEKLQVPGLDNN